MMKLIRTNIFFLLASAIIVSCASVQIQPEKSFQFDGFSIQSPDSEGWFVLNKSDMDMGVFFGKETPKGVYHTFRAYVLTTTTRLFLTTDDLLSYLQSDVIQTTSRQKNIKLKTSIEKRHGVECVLYDFSMEDHGVPYAPGLIFNIVGGGALCPHPDFPETYVVDIAYSQRFLQGEEPLPSELERDSFINSLVFLPLLD